MKSFLRVAGRLAGFTALTMVLVGMARAQNDTITPDPYQKSKEPVYLAASGPRPALRCPAGIRSLHRPERFQSICRRQSGRMAATAHVYGRPGGAGTKTGLGPVPTIRLRSATV